MHEGYIGHTLTDVHVRVGRTTEVSVQLAEGSFSDALTVTNDSAVIDPEQISLSRTFTATYLEHAAVGSGQRSYQTVLTQTAGVVGGSNPNVLGSSSGENAYYVDGFNTTDPVTATWSGNYTFDVVQEIALESGGFEAEFGGAAGGVINVVTKSGGNSLSGSFDVRYSDEDFQENGTYFDRSGQTQTLRIPSATLGGPFIRDRLWFFGAFSPVTTERTPTGALTTRRFNGDYWLGKLSYQLNPSWRVVLKGNGDPTDIENVAGSAARRPPETQALQEQGGTLFQAETSGILAGTGLVVLRGGHYATEINVVPMSGDVETPGQLNVTTGDYSVNYANAQFSDRERDFLAGALTWPFDSALGEHSVKLGFEVSDTLFRRQNFTTGNYFITRRIVTGADIPRNFIFNPNRDINTFDGQLRSVYAQDAWQPTPQLTVKAGLRYDSAEFANNLGDGVADFERVQPRLGVAWDIGGESKRILRASWGQFMHPNALTAASFAERGANELPVVTAWSCDYIRRFTFGLPVGDPTSCSELAAAVASIFGWSGEIIGGPGGLDPEGWIVSNISGGAGAPNQIDPNLDPTYQETLTIGFEQQIAPRTSLSLTYVDKETFDIFEDTCDGALPTPSLGHSCRFYVMANLPELKRTYRGVLAQLETRRFDWLYLTTSLTWSETKGSIGNTQNVGTAFDFFPDHYVNRFGYLGSHREWWFKLNGFVNLPKGFVLGVNGVLTSPYRFNAREPSEIAGYGSRFVEPRGSRSGDSYHQLDVQLEKRFRLGEWGNVSLIGTVVNLLDSELVTGRCGQVQGCTDALGNRRELGEPTAWQQPRRYEIGLRATF